MNPWEEENDAKRKAIMDRVDAAKAEGPEACLRMTLELIPGYSQEEVEKALLYLHGAQTSAFILADTKSQALIATASTLLWQAWKGMVQVCPVIKIVAWKKEEGK
mgnify:FL=1